MRALAGVLVLLTVPLGAVQDHRADAITQAQVDRAFLGHGVMVT